MLDMGSDSVVEGESSQENIGKTTQETEPALRKPLTECAMPPDRHIHNRANQALLLLGAVILIGGSAFSLKFSGRSHDTGDNSDQTALKAEKDSTDAEDEPSLIEDRASPQTSNFLSL